MTDLDNYVERLNKIEDVVAFVRRPAGVAILVGLFVLAGLMHLFAALGAITGAAGAATNMFAGIPLLGDAVAILAGVSAILFVLAIVDFVLAWAVWDLQSWAWGVGLAVAIVHLLIPTTLFLGILMLVYFALQDVRAAYKEDFRTLRAAISARRVE